MMRSGSHPSPEFVILTGALGSGKTTLLSEYLSSGDMRDTGVIVNDAGEINVDGAVIAADSRNLAVATLSDGCICCSMGNSVQEGIDSLLDTRAQRGLGPVRRIILETSGLAEPGPILRALREIRQLEFRVRIVSTFDATVRDRAFLPQYAAQLAAAQVIVVTKLDAPSRGIVEDRVADARSFNPLAPILADGAILERACTAFEMEAADTLQPPPQGFAATEVTGDRISVAVARWDSTASWQEVGEWIENVSGYFDTRLLRMKGLVRPLGAPNPLLVNGVGGIFSPPRAVKTDREDDLGLVMILRDVDPSEFVLASPTNPAMELSIR